MKAKPMVGGVCSEAEEMPFLGHQWLEAVKGQPLAVVCLPFSLEVLPLALTG